MRSHGFIWTTCLVVACGGATIDAAELQPRTVTAWNAYVAATERRIAHELTAEDGFLVQDFHDAAAAARRAVLAGRILVDRMRYAKADRKRPSTYTRGPSTIGAAASSCPG